MSSHSSDSEKKLKLKKVKVYTRQASAEEIKMLNTVRKQADTLEWTEMIGDDADPINQMKFAICQEFIGLQTQINITQVKLAEIVGVNRSRINDIIHCRFHLFSLETLICYLLKLEGMSLRIDKRISDIKLLTRLS